MAFSKITDEQIAELRSRIGKPVTRVIVTHYHPDHLGMAGWLCRKWDVPLEITAWTHFAVVYRDNTPSLYVNGTLAATGPRSSIRSASAIWRRWHGACPACRRRCSPGSRRGSTAPTPPRDLRPGRRPVCLLPGFRRDHRSGGRQGGHAGGGCRRHGPRLSGSADVHLPAVRHAAAVHLPVHLRHAGAAATR